MKKTAYYKKSGYKMKGWSAFSKNEKNGDNEEAEKNEDESIFMPSISDFKEQVTEMEKGNVGAFRKNGGDPPKKKKKIDPDAPGTPGRPGYEPPVRRSDLDKKGRAIYDAKKKKKKKK